jgi:protein regulator of cytokinesis 1
LVQIPAGSCDDNDLALHEQELENLKVVYEEIKPILKLVQRREQTVADRYELDTLQKDSSRLSLRGARFTEQLAKEERMTKRIKALPKLTDELVAKLVQWERDHGRPFMYEDKRYLETITEQENKWFEHKEAEKAAKEARRKGMESSGSFRDSPSRSPKAR